MTSVPQSAQRVSRFWQRHPRAVDVLVGVCWLLLSIPSLFFSAEGSRLTVGLAVAYLAITLVVGVALILFRRRRPLLAFAISFVVTLPMMVLGPDVPTVATAFCVFAIAVYDSARHAWMAAAITAATTVLASLMYLFLDLPLVVPLSGTSRMGSVITYAVTGLLVLLVALLWGQNSGNRKRYIDGLLEHARHLEHERDQQAQLAALAERSRIARDVHDIVSHSLSVIVRLSDGASAVFDQEPARAKEAVGQIGGVARSSLTEMRRVIGVLESASGPTVPQSGSGFDDLPRLMEVYRGIGLPVEFHLVGTPPTETGVQMTVFRVIQEALTNALRHASTPRSVSVTVEIDDDVTVTVRNDGSPLEAPPEDHVGRGLLGMRERAALYEGTLTAGPDGEGNWSVQLVLPQVDR